MSTRRARSTSHNHGARLWRGVARPVGLVIGVVSIAMLLTAGVGLLMDSPEGALTMVMSAGIVGALAVLLLSVGTRVKGAMLGRREALLIVAVSWALTSLMGGIPFIIGAEFSVADAIFEGTSGFTTTGATIMTHIEGQLDPALHFWRVLMHWLGGMGIVVLFVAVFPALGVGGRHLFFVEAAGPKSKGLSPRIRERSSVLWRVYLTITLVEVAVLMLVGLDLFQASVHALSTMGTGGFSTLNTSVSGFNNPGVEWVILFFMLLAGTNFMLYAEALKRGPKVFWEHTETRVYLMVFGLVSVACAWMIWPEKTSVEETIRDASFQVAAIMTTTGFGTDDFEVWPSFAKLLLVGLFFLGGCSGSTAGGMKIFRIMVLIKAAFAEIRRSFRPHLITPVRLGRTVISSDSVREVFAFSAMFAFTVLAGGVVVALLDNVDGTTSMMASLSCVANVGPGLGLVGPTDNFAFFSPETKVFLSGLMILGRLEILTVAALFLPSFWRK
jgi:trk system potassium uptake protein TrkH